MPQNQPSPPLKRVDAERNREKILAVARAAFDGSEPDISMAEISRRAGVGMATLYRNFPGRLELLEAIWSDEIDAVCRAAETVTGETPGAVFTAWLHQFFIFSSRKRHIASELLSHVESDSPVFSRNRAKVMAASGPLLTAAQHSHEIRQDLTLRQILDMIVAIAAIRGDAAYIEPIFLAALDGLRSPAGTTGR
ncbi:AcrR family transcriptional regulator [Thermocatellispora tengchongensis]|uniref:AcrR family transcriptional regulator n=1 Tax=Thermocatellispora tengchongensis TaxID=1073253 RepID=A0A840PCP8_9ACTN|nr:TetR/AcrR family transcriptional regulator [Thermocatellispora tengchongensis]MBB5136759.1 AcrR family transcriptional regulator [Thermocatellispora tengchongensis]